MRALARVDVGAIERNCARLAAVAAPARLCAVVKADGYGHGAAAAARAAHAGGAAWLAVATAQEARALRDAGLGGLLLHAANSAATLAEPAARLGMVRCGVAIYGLDPFQRDPADHGLEPALQLRSYVAEVKRCRPGESTGYGRRFVAERE